MSDSKQCSSCYFFKREKTSASCMRFPPNSNALGNGRPQVRGTDYCGEYQNSETDLSIKQIGWLDKIFNITPAEQLTGTTGKGNTGLIDRWLNRDIHRV